MGELTVNVLKIFILGTFSFALSFLLTPPLANILYRYRLWKKETREKSIDGREVPVFRKYHKEREKKVPRFGGLLIWVSTLFLALFFFLLGIISDNWWIEKLNFFSRSQTWLPFFALVSASLVGFLDDILVVFSRGKYVGGGLKLRYRLVLMALIGLIGGWWFYSKLGYSTIHIPGNGDIFFGFWYIPLFLFVMMATYSGGVIDGLDGLSGGVFAVIFGAFAGIALFRGQVDLAAFCTVLSGAILAFLWFNIPPARFYMGETGMMGLCAVLTVVAFLTDSILVLPIIAFLLVLESASVIIQLISKKLFKRRVFLAAPIHHHFEAKGWPHYKITMRFWVIGIVVAIIGLAVRLLG